MRDWRVNKQEPRNMEPQFSSVSLLGSSVEEPQNSTHEKEQSVNPGHFLDWQAWEEGTACVCRER